MNEATLPGGPGGAGAPGAAADLDEKVLDEAVRRGLITAVQGSGALEEARARRVPLVEVLREKGLVSEEAARDLDEETREDFLPGYRVLSKLGEGGMGVVYKALQKRLDRVVALKVVMPHLAADASYLKRFEREAKAVAKLNHPNIVAAYDYGESKGRVFLAMEFVEGVNAAESIRTHGRMEEDRALAVTREVASGLAHACAAGIIHRDIKPANILLAARKPGETASGGTAAGAKVTDLGLARSAGGSSELTAAGAILGTPGYMAPEQVFGKEVDHRADIYALGATLYQLLTGLRPFDASTPVAVIARQQAERLPDPRDFRPEISAGTAALLQGMLSRERDTRYPAYRDLLADLDAVRRGEMPSLPPPPPEHCSLAAPTGQPAGGTLVLPPPSSRAAPVKTVIGSSAGMAAASREASPPPRSKAGLYAGIAVAVLAVAALAVLKPWRKEGESASPSPPGSPRPPAMPEPPAPQQPLGPLDEEAPEAGGGKVVAEVQRALDAGDEGAAIHRLAEAKRKLDAMAPAERRRFAQRATRLDEMMGRARKAGEGRITELWKKGEYEKALEMVGKMKSQMGTDAGDALGRLHDRLASIGDRGTAERAAFLRAKEARAKNDPLAVLAALDGFEQKYADFSPDLDSAKEMRDWAEEEAPEITVATDPAGAEFLIVERSYGKTPWTGRRPIGRYPAQFRLEGFRPLERLLEVEREGKRAFTFPLEALPPPDPVPAAELVPQGRPRPLWMGDSMGDWNPRKNSWSTSDPAKKAWIEGEERSQPPNLLRGAGKGLGWARLNTATMVKDAPGWRLEWQMFGEGRRSGGVARVEMHFAVRRTGEALALGIDDQDVYLGVRDTNSGTLVRTHHLAGVAAGAGHTFVVANHGDAFVATVDGRKVGAVKVPADLVPEGTIHAAVEDGAGYFSDILLQALKRP